MSMVKRWIEEQESRGFNDVGEKFVCSECFDDPGLKAFVTAHAQQPNCSYCKRTSDTVIAAPIDEVLACIVSGLRSIYGDPNEEGKRGQSYNL